MAEINVYDYEPTKLTLRAKLMHIQAELKAPKNLFNKFGNYSYRNAEGIQEALKPLEVKYGVMVTLIDNLDMVGDRVYVKAVATIYDTESDDSISAWAYAREAETKKGMDDAQVTGATSSYARKYALNGLFLLDDTKDIDSEEYQAQSKAEANKATSKKAEKAEPKKSDTKQPLSEKEMTFLKQRYTGDNLAKLLDFYKIERLDDIDPEVARNLIKQIVARAKKAKEEQNNG